MKKTIIILTLASAVTVFAATLTITIPANDIPRVQEAFGSVLNLGRPATSAEIQTAIHQWIVNTTQDYERRKNITAFTPPPMEMQPSPTPTPAPSPTARATR